MQLSKRLLAAAGLVTKGNRVADIGCDHAYTSIYLCREGIAPSVIATDVNRGPLLRAQQHVAEAGLSGRIVLRLSDGLSKIEPGEADTLLLTGMGGLLMIKILSEFPKTTAAAKELVLQPQSEIAQVRRYLHNKNWEITKECMVKEDGRFYAMFCAQHALVPQQYSKECCYVYGKLLLEEGSPVVAEFLARERMLREEVLAQLSGKEGERAAARRTEIDRELAVIDEAEELMGNGKADKG